jgi:putative transposase
VSYPSDLTDDQWRLVRRLFDPPGRRGRPARIPRRQLVNAVLYQARTGCQWRYLPRQFGPWGAIWQQFRRWRDTGTWEQALTLLRRTARARAGRSPEPSMVMLDSQTVKGGRAGPGFHDVGGKYGNTVGAKRTVLVDYLGLPVAARVDSARPHDSKTGRVLLNTALPALPAVTDVLADLAFEPLVAEVYRRHTVNVVIKGWRGPYKPVGFKPIEPLWKVEDCFAQLGRWRRLARCFEATTTSATAWLHVVCVAYLLTKV